MPNHLHLEKIIELMKKALTDKGIKIIDEPFFVQDNLLSSVRSKGNKGNDLLFSVSSMFKGETPEKNTSIFQVTTKVESYESDWYVDNQSYFDMDVVTSPTKYPTEFEVTDMLQEAMNNSSHKYDDISMDYILRINPDKKRFGPLSKEFSIVFVASHLDGFDGLFLGTVRNDDGRYNVYKFNEFNLIVEYNHYIYIRLGNSLNGYEFCPLGLKDDNKEGFCFREAVRQFNFEFIKEFDFITYLTHYIFYQNNDFAIIYHDGEYYLLPEKDSEISIKNVEKFGDNCALKLNAPCEIEKIIPVSYNHDNENYYAISKTPYHTQKYDDKGVSITECVYNGCREYDEILFINPCCKEYIIKYKNGTQSILQVNKEEVKDGSSRTNTRFKHIRY